MGVCLSSPMWGRALGSSGHRTAGGQPRPQQPAAPPAAPAGTSPPFAAQAPSHLQPLVGRLAGLVKPPINMAVDACRRVNSEKGSGGTQGQDGTTATPGSGGGGGSSSSSTSGSTTVGSSNFRHTCSMSTVQTAANAVGHCCYICGTRKHGSHSCSLLGGSCTSQRCCTATLPPPPVPSLAQTNRTAQGSADANSRTFRWVQS